MTTAATSSASVVAGDASNAGDPPPAPPKKRREWLPIALATIVFAALSLTAAVKSEGFLEADACTHYQYAKFALAEPHYFVNVWGRPFVTALYAVPATLAGRIGVRVTSMMCALIIATVAWRIARDQNYRWPALAFMFTVAQPLVFLHSFSELTELPFAVLLVLAFWAYRRQQWLIMTILIGLTPTARPEGFGFLMLAALALVLHRRPRWLLVLSIPLLIWCYAGWHLYGQPAYADALSQRLPESLRWLMWLRHEWPYQPESLYASGRLYHFIGLLPAVVSPALLPFVMIGICKSLGESDEATKRRSDAGKEGNAAPSSPSSLRGCVASSLHSFSTNHLVRTQLLIAAIPLMILIGHSVLYWLGKMASNGELRYMLIVAPFWGLLAARGWEWTFARLNWRHVYIPAGVAALLPILANVAYPVIPIHLSGDGHKAREVARWYRHDGFARDYPRITTSNPEIAYFMGVSHTDDAWVREWRRDLLLKPQPGTLLVWDPVYAKYNSDANRVVSLNEVRAAGWVELPQLADAFNPISSGEPWHFFVSPSTIFGKQSY